LSSVLQIIAGPLFDLFDKLIPDADAKAKAKFELLRMEQAGTFKEIDAQVQIALAQNDVNKVEAAAPDLFTRGWRPFVGWVCGLGLCSEFLIRPYVMAFSVVVVPSLDMGTLLALLGGLLGLGTLRTVEKVKGAAR
jgi:hypothetical protein